MKVTKTLMGLLLSLSLLLSGCGQPAKDGETPGNPDDNAGTSQTPVTSTVIIPEDMFSDRDYETAYDSNKCGRITFNGTSIQSSTDAAKISGTTVQITEEGTYVLSGTLDDGQIVINAENTDKIQLVLDGVSINSSTSAAIYVLQADKVFITTAKGTENNLSNGGSFVAIDDNNIDAAIFSKDDLTLNGEGSLTVTSPAGHGVVSKDDLVVTCGTYVISSASHALSGKESIRIAGGTFHLTAGKDGIHAENADDTTLGFGYISGGTFTISSEGDGISASNSLQIAGGNFDITAGGGSENGDKANSGNYGGFMGGGFGGHGGGRPGGMGGNSSSTETEDESASMKGIKAAGDLTIQGGTFKINCADDGVHSNTNVTVTGGTFDIATGDDGFHADETLTVTNGVITVTESYEGLEGHHIAVSGGDISLVASDDGLNAAGGVDSSGTGGRDQMFGRPGGMGGMGGMSSGDGSIVISGGILYVQASGDGIDANGTLEITGGYTTVCGPTQGDTATLDYDVSATISGGTFIGTGASGMAQTFSDSKQGVVAVQVGNCSANTQITLTDANGKTVISHAPKLNFAVVILSSPDIVKGETYTITVGSQSGSFQAK